MFAPTRSQPKSIASPVSLKISELFPLDSSENPAQSFDEGLSSLYKIRDRLAKNALPGTVQPYEKYGKTYYKRHFYCSKRKQTISQSVSAARVHHVRQQCADWHQLQEVNQAIKEHCEWRDRYAHILRGVP